MCAIQHRFLFPFFFFFSSSPLFSFSSFFGKDLGGVAWYQMIALVFWADLGLARFGCLWEYVYNRNRLASEMYIGVRQVNTMKIIRFMHRWAVDSHPPLLYKRLTIMLLHQLCFTSCHVGGIHAEGLTWLMTAQSLGFGLSLESFTSVPFQV